VQKPEALNCRRELVALFLESPLYFDLPPRARLAVIRRHEGQGADCLRRPERRVAKPRT
jgi:hypothetical protein